MGIIASINGSNCEHSSELDIRFEAGDDFWGEISCETKIIQRVQRTMQTTIVSDSSRHKEIDIRMAFQFVE